VPFLGCTLLILAIETTDKAGSVALLNGPETLSEIELNPAQRSAQSLAPGIEALLAQAGRKPSEVKLVAVADGPGSFTGLRVGVTTAKLFAYSVGAEVLGVDALEAIARQAQIDTAILWAVMDAQRNELFAAKFSRSLNGERIQQGETEIISNAVWLEGLNRETAVSGPGLTKLLVRFPDDVPRVDSALWTPRAATIGQIAYERFAAGARQDVFQLIPRYFRRSAAEEKRDSPGG
jgi:tRNA threonylcarbamoyladenosine biosynthesis protein TsaB